MYTYYQRCWERYAVRLVPGAVIGAVLLVLGAVLYSY